MELQQLHRVGPLNGATLNTEEISGLESAMQQRKLEENLVGKMCFWGKIYGSTQDYLIVYNTNPFLEFPTKKFYFCTTSDFTLKALKPISDEYKLIAEKIIDSFTGDASFFAYNGEEAAEDPEGPPVERFREQDRLSYTVAKIDHDCAIVPRGSYVIDAGKKVIANAYFEGLHYQTASELRAYLHLRQPENLQGVALLKRPGIIKSGDFLDCINKDRPDGMWTISYNSAGTQAFVRNIYWEGYAFYSVLTTPEYGGCYFGNGIPTYDIAFML